MKKIILGVTFIAAFAFVAGYGVYASQHEVEMSDLAMANVEALASGESTSNTGPGKTYDCPGLGTGDGKMCMSENSNPCTQIPC